MHDAALATAPAQAPPLPVAPLLLLPPLLHGHPSPTHPPTHTPPPQPQYFTRVAEHTPEDTMMLTLGCGKFRVSRGRAKGWAELSQICVSPHIILNSLCIPGLQDLGRGCMPVDMHFKVF